MISMTREEYEAKYGIAPSIKPAGTIKMTREQYEKTYNPKPFRFDVPKIEETKEQKIARYQSETEAFKKEADKYKGVGFLLQFGKELGSSLAAPVIGLGQTIAKSQEDLSGRLESIESLTEDNLFLIKTIKQKEAEGLDATNLKRMYNSNADLIEQENQYIKNYSESLPTNSQVIGQIGGTALDVLTAGTYGKAATGLKTFTRGKALPSIIPTGKVGLGKEILKGAGVGYAFDVTMGLQQGETMNANFGDSPIAPGFGTAIGAAFPIANRFIQKGKIPEIELKKIEQDYLDNILTTTKSNANRLNLLKRQGINVETELVRRGIIPDVVDGKARFGIDEFDLDGQKVLGNRDLLEERQQIINILDQHLERYRPLNVSSDEIRQAINDAVKSEIQIVNAGRAKEVTDEALKILQRYEDAFKTKTFSIPDIHSFKKAQYVESSKFKNALAPDPQKTDGASVIAKAFKELIENKADDIAVRDLNKEIGKLQNLNDYLIKIDNTAVKGGRLGIYLARAIGSSAGSSGGIIGSIVGAMGGDVLARLLQQNAITTPLKRYYLRKIGLGYKNPVYEKAVDYLDAVAKGKVPKVPQAVLNQIKQDLLNEASLLLPPRSQAVRNSIASGPAIKVAPSDVQMESVAKEPFIGSQSPIRRFIERVKNTPNKQGGFIRIGKDSTSYKTKNTLNVKDVSGNKFEIPAGTVVKAGQGKGSNAVIEFGDKSYTINKGQFENLKAQSISGEAKKFAPELEGLEESVKGVKGSDAELEKLGYKVEKDMDGEVYVTKDGEDIDFEDIPIKIKKLIRNAEEANPTKYSSYQLPDGKNYKEILIKAPTSGEKVMDFRKDPYTYITRDGRDIIKQTFYDFPGKSIKERNTGKSGKIIEIIDENTAKIQLNGEEIKEVNLRPKIDKGFRSSHWEEPNVISHLRMNERTYKGKKVAFMEELQSDWAREARAGKTTATAPQLKNWQELSIKRALKEAVDNNSEYFAWINGEQTSARYNLATHLDNVEWYSSKNTVVNPNKQTRILNIDARDKGKLQIKVSENGEILEGIGRTSDWKGKKLDEVLGKGLADSIMSKESGTLSGEGLKFGGEWANNLYDKQVGNIVSDLTGAKVEKLDLGLPIEKQQNQIRNWDTNSFLKIEDIKNGQKISVNNADYIITDILGDGKFKAISRDRLRGQGQLSDKDIVKWANDNPSSKETFDISTKTTTQQGIKLTPEIKAIIRGESPLKNSGKITTGALVAGSSMPIIFNLFMENEQKTQ